MQDQLRAAKDSVQNMQRLHEYGQSQIFELRAQSGAVIIPLLSRSDFLLSTSKTAIILGQINPNPFLLLAINLYLKWHCGLTQYELELCKFEKKFEN